MGVCKVQCLDRPFLLFGSYLRVWSSCKKLFLNLKTFFKKNLGFSIPDCVTSELLIECHCRQCSVRRNEYIQVDYYERAKRLEEIPLLQKYYEEERLRMKEVWEQQEQERVGVCSVIM